MGRVWHGTWHPVQSDGSHCVMKYKHMSTVHREWLTGVLHKITEILTKLVINKINPNEQYTIGKFNLLKNDGLNTHDQQPHNDYPPRMST